MNVWWGAKNNDNKYYFHDNVDERKNQILTPPAQILSLQRRLQAFHFF